VAVIIDENHSDEMAIDIILYYCYDTVMKLTTAVCRDDH
jgi:hypothetical protein